MSFYQAQLQPYSVSGGGVVAGAVTVTLKSFETIEGVPLTMADFGTIGYGTLEPGNGNQEEQISFTGVTQNASGTATLTGIKNVLFISPYTETSGLSKTHPGSSAFVISNTSGFYEQFGRLANDEIITGNWTGPNPVGAQSLVTRDWILALINGGAITTNALIVSGTAGETVASGTPVYLKVADGRWWKALGTTAATLNNVQLGVAQGSGTAGNPITGGVLRSGLTSNLSGGSIGLAYISDTGTITTVTGTVERVVGVFLTATSALIDPNFYYLLSANQKAALAGTFGTPSGSNTFVTSVGTSAGATDQSQVTQNGTFAVGEADATTKHNKIAQSFIPAKTIIKSVNLYKSANTGTFTGTVKVAIQADSAGNPSGVDLASKTITNALYNAYPTGDFLALLSSELTVTPGNLYWAVVTTSTSDNANCINLGTNTAGGYASGSLKYDNTTDGWVAVSTIDLYFKINEGFNGKAVDANTSGFVPFQASLTKMKTGQVTLSTTLTTTFSHGLGKLPMSVEATYAGGSSVYGAYSTGVYDVANNAYITDGFTYNEGTSGERENATNGIVTTFNTVGGGTARITVTVDENVVVFSTDANAGLISVKVTG